MTTTYPLTPGHEIVDSCRECGNCRPVRMQYCVPGETQPYNSHRCPTGR